MGPGKLVRHMQNLLYTYEEYLICIRLGPSISSVICKNLSYSGPSYPSSPVYIYILLVGTLFRNSMNQLVLDHSQIRNVAARNLRAEGIEYK